MILQGKSKIPVREAILHCAAIATGQFAGMRPFQVFAKINQWHTERGFRNGFGYHGLIMPDGEYFSGRPWEMIGAHVIGHNTGTLGFLLIESRKIVPPASPEAPPRGFGDFYTSSQAHSLRALLASIQGLEKVSGHNDYANKLCPGFKVHSHEWL